MDRGLAVLRRGNTVFQMFFKRSFDGQIRELDSFWQLQLQMSLS